MNVIPENKVTLGTLAAHLENAGWDVSLERNCVLAHSEGGLAFTTAIHEDRKFLGLCTYLPVRPDVENLYELVNTLNSEIFLASFSLLENRNLRAVYYMNYSRGLLLSQYARIVSRFATVIDCARSRHDPDVTIFAIGNSNDEEPACCPRMTIH